MMDDILVHGKTQEQHDSRLQEVLRRIISRNERSSQNNLIAVCESPNIPVYLPIPMYGLVVYQGRQIFPRI